MKQEETIYTEEIKKEETIPAEEPAGESAPEAENSAPEAEKPVPEAEEAAAPEGKKKQKKEKAKKEKKPKEKNEKAPKAPGEKKGLFGAKKPKKEKKAPREPREPRQKKKGSAVTTVLLVLIMIAGLGLILYPTFSDYWNSFHQSRAIAGYAEAVAEIDDDQYKEMLDEAVRYNRDLRFAVSRFKPSAEDTKRYNSILNVSNTGIIGYIEIPSIKVDLPIYHGTDEAVLQIAIGHIEGTSLPVGGAGTHAVVSGHRGLPSAKLFTNLDKLGEGDIFMIRVLNEVLTYMVDQVLIVEPSDISALEIDPRKDYCTLVTCTPYGVNTHRMLVRGVRIDNLKDSAPIMATADAQQIDRNIVALFLGGPFLIFFFFRDMITGGKRSRARLARWEELDDEFERMEYGDDFFEEAEPETPTGTDPPEGEVPEEAVQEPEKKEDSGEVKSEDSET